MRIEWEPLDLAILTVSGTTARTHRGAIVTEVASNVLDARWLADGQIVTIDRTCDLRWSRDGTVTAHRVGGRASLVDATLSADGGTYATTDERGAIYVEDWLGGLPFHPSLPGAVLDGRTASLALSGNGARLAVGYDTEQPGRGVAVFDLEHRKLVERTWQAQPLARSARMALAFDHAGKRLAQGMPEEGVPALGVLRIKKGERYARTRIGGAIAVALEDRGNLVAYAHRVPPPGARGRLQFDYLQAGVKGGEIVEVLDTQTLESELPDLVALAFSRDRRRLACLASTGDIEVVPVP
ncbi:hypothetical protein BH11MYX1_BH11MYX1_57770 [soil metagenome]